MKKLATMMAAIMLLSGTVAWAANEADLQAQVKALQSRVAQLESQQTEQRTNERIAELARKMVAEMAASRPLTAANTGLTAGYDKRFFIKSADDQFKLEFDARFQFRHSYWLADKHDKIVTKEGLTSTDIDNINFGLGPDDQYTYDGVDSSANAFELERARLILRGQLLNNLKFKIQLDGDDDDADAVDVLDYWVAYSFMPELGIRVGRDKAAFGKQENTSSGRLMLVDRSLANEVFNISRATGIEVFGDLPAGDTKLNYRVGLYNDFRDQGSTPFENDNNPAIASRLVLPLLGATTADFENESDYMNHENAVMQLGTSFAYDNSTQEDHFAGGDSENYDVLVPGGDGMTNIVKLGGEATMFGADVAMKYQGLSVILEGFYQHTNVDTNILEFAHDFGSARDTYGIEGHEFDNYGWIAQSGYFIVPKTFELVSRISDVCVDNSNDSYEYAGGWNWYLAGQDLKISMDVTYIDDLPLESSSANLHGIQNNSLFLIRTQLQMQF